MCLARGGQYMRTSRSIVNVAAMLSMMLLVAGIASTSALWQPVAEAVEWRGASQSEQDVRVLEVGKPIERELAGGQVHAYRMMSAVGQYLRVVVDQRGIDVVVTLFGPDAKKLVEIDSPNGDRGPEQVSIVAKVPGNHRLEVRSLDKAAAAGRYEAKITVLRDATLEDKTEYLAATLAEAKTEAERTALRAAEKELVTEKLVQALNKLGDGQRMQGKYAEALTHFRFSQNIAEQIGDKAGIASALRNIGVVHDSQGNYAQALEHYQKSLTLSEALGNKAEIARTLNNIGIVHGSQGNYAQALEYFRKSLTLSEALGNKDVIARALVNIGRVHYSQGNYAQALEHYQKSLTLSEALGDKDVIARTLNNIGNVHNSQGNYAQALEDYHKCLTLSEALRDKAGIARTLNNIGVVHESQGNYAQALEYYQKSLTLKETLGDKAGIAATLNNIGIVHISQGNYAQALEYFRKSLTLSEALGNKDVIAITLGNIGSVYRSQGKYAQALEHFQKSLTLRETLGDKAGIAETLGDIGEMYRLQGNYTQTLEFTQRAATIARSIGARETLWQSLTNAGRAYQHLNQPGEARQALEEAITLVEVLRSQVSGQESRASYFASRQEVYEFYIDLLMQMRRLRPDEGNEAIAFQSSERARVRSLLELLTEARADIRQGIDPALLERERSLHHQLNARGERQTRLLSGKHTEEQAMAIKKEIDNLTDEFRQVQAQIRQSSPRYAALTQPAPLSLKEIQERVLDDDSLLLEYALGEERSYLWAVTPTSITSYELPKRAEIEAAAKRAYDLLLVSNQRRAKRQAELAAAGLSRLLLGPVAGKLGSKRLLIVSDGALQYVPFGALPKPQSGKAATREPQSPAPLIADHEVVHLPSASTIAVLRREQAGRQPASKTVAVLADPVLTPDDPRVKPAMARGSQNAGKAAPVSDVTRGATDNLVRSAKETGVVNWERLPFSRQEAEAIAQMAQRQSFKALDFEASRATATSPELSQYRIVHFPTHGFLNSQHPELSGIVLSLVDERGQSQDGFLRLHDIYNLKLDADLVALSACQTALGNDVKGEGLIGLTRGFMYAGAPRVIASLWSVKDDATAELMKRFYRGMLKDELRPAAALREAQLSMWREKRWEAPYYWAGFALQGEWR